jgi:pullulanase
MYYRACLLTALLMATATVALAQGRPLSPSVRYIPGQQPSPTMDYENPSARRVEVAISADEWAGRYPLQRRGRIWVLDIRRMELPMGRHEYKFIVDGEWESGANRILFINEQGLLYRSPEVIAQARVQETNVIELLLRAGVPDARDVNVAIYPDVSVRDVRMTTPEEEGYVQGYTLQDDQLTFYFNPKLYGVRTAPNDLIVVAGNFNHWDSSGRQGTWQMRYVSDTGLWEMTTQLSGLRPPPGQRVLEFRFVINRNQWLPAPAEAPNRSDDGRGNVNLMIERSQSGGRSLRIYTEEPLDVSENYLLVIDGLTDRRVYQYTTPGALMDTFVSEKSLGVTLDRENNITTYRLFAPRATDVYLCIYNRPEYQIHQPQYQRIEPVEMYPMWKDQADGVWELSLIGLDIGKYYSYRVAGPEGEGEEFHPNTQVGDPYALAAAIDSDYNNIVLDPLATNRWFTGWTNEEYVTPDHEDLVIYEMHIRDMTAHPSSRVPPSLRGTYAGLLASEGTGTGLDHLSDLGVNMIELLPMQEFQNPENRYDWGYATVFFFAPEASYARAPGTGSQYYEFKHLVNELHNRGFGVMLDVVYNHIGSPNIFSLIDRKYYFRLNPDFSFSNFSGVGNDIRSEAPMMRRLIVENIVFLMEEFKVDGFRFDLAELIDMETLLQVRDEAIKVNPNVVLVSEPWSFRGTHKYELTGTGWAAWNDDFRYTVKDFVMGGRNLERLRQVIVGSTDLWTANPLQTVNYVESHDDMALADELSTRPDRDGCRLQTRDVAANRLAATVVFTSLGMPMLQSGQEFLRSKHGVSNTYNRGDELNALRWTDRDRPLAAEALAYYRNLIHLRQSDAGRAFRVATLPPADYYQWIETNSDQALGYMVNVGHRHPGNAFVVLLNGSHESVNFPVSVPAGCWRVIGNGREINPAGVPRTEIVSGPVNTRIRVPSMSSVILMDGF